MYRIVSYRKTFMNFYYLLQKKILIKKKKIRFYLISIFYNYCFILK